MIFIYIQTLKVKKGLEIPYRISVKRIDDDDVRFIPIHPQYEIQKRMFQRNNLEASEILNAPLFIDLADELIELFYGHQLVFFDLLQFKLLKSQFKSIGYNFEIKPILIWKPSLKHTPLEIDLSKNKSSKYSEDFAKYALNQMQAYITTPNYTESKERPIEHEKNGRDLSQYKLAPGVYYFLNAYGEVVYAGKAKNIRKRLQSHFSKSGKRSNIDYSLVNTIQVTYTGNDFIAQLIESNAIKDLKPQFNTQQVHTSAPYIISQGHTAKGIAKLKITRKDYLDQVPEQYFNRASVKQTLENFCKTHNLCRKHCGIETVKGPCSKYTKWNKGCVCSGDESIDNYNIRFKKAFKRFQTQKTRTLYKLKGRHKNEDAFVYDINGIYQGYGFIDKSEAISTESDILGYLSAQVNNYDTSRILSSVKRSIRAENIIHLSEI
ncbi:GIY-YIG nuclease family protein [Winogradskyella forsetii]|uniref:GIY-YIG nuclease family protein n=1 Tax=Winogradskyella forsetii TaxID=2686077 RepID=UPI0015BD5ADB|nr:GIY-YIG nuclease family protein [Winogradskyella forsetii]